MAESKHTVTEGRQDQGPSEEIQYTILVAGYGESPGLGTASVIDVTSGDADVTATVLAGGTALSESGGTLTLPVLAALTENHKYRLYYPMKFGNSWTYPYLDVVCTED